MTAASDSGGKGGRGWLLYQAQTDRTLPGGRSAGQSHSGRMRVAGRTHRLPLLLPLALGEYRCFHSKPFPPPPPTWDGSQSCCWNLAFFLSPVGFGVRAGLTPTPPPKKTAGFAKSLKTLKQEEPFNTRASSGVSFLFLRIWWVQVFLPMEN